MIFYEPDSWQLQSWSLSHPALWGSRTKYFPPSFPLLSILVIFRHSWPHLARARQAGARSWQWPHLGLASEVIKILRKGEEEVGQKNDQVRTKLEGADRSPVEVDEPGCVPVENALLELSAVKKFNFIWNFWIMAAKISWVDENAQQYSMLPSPPISSISYR